MTLTTTDDRVDVPEFATAMRGYDRAQVDEYIARIDRWSQEAKTRAVAAEDRVRQLQTELNDLRGHVRELEAGKPQSSVEALDDVGIRIETMLKAAISECDELRKRGAEEAASAVGLARETAVEIVSRARAMVHDLGEAAQQDRAETARARDEAREHARQEAETAAAATIAEAEQRRAHILEAGEQYRRAVEEEVASLISQRD